MYQIIEVPSDASDLPEALGTKPKFWYSDSIGRSLLYKQGRPGSGEHWSEKICCEIAQLLWLPHAMYDLATWRGEKGVVSPNFVPEGGRLILGNELLAKLVYSTYQQNAKRFQARQHSVRTVLALLSRNWIQPPIAYTMPQQLKSAADLFAGYVLLDALVGNQDRHHENWGLVLVLPRGGESRIALAPTYDHASSLGRNERDEERIRRLTTKDQGSSLEHYVRRANSAFFPSPTSTKPLSTFGAFQEAHKVAPRAGDYWLERLSGITLDMYRDVIASVPAQEMSKPARDFALRMLELNAQRLLLRRE
jgi:hypothetical protein